MGLLMLLSLAILLFLPFGPFLLQEFQTPSVSLSTYSCYSHWPRLASAPGSIFLLSTSLDLPPPFLFAVSCEMPIFMAIYAFEW